VITATDLELRAGSRILLSGATLRVQPGDRIGLVGRNGPGKTTSMRVLAGEGEPYGGSVSANSPVGYLPQDPREGDLRVTAKDRVLSAKGLDVMLRQMEKAQTAMAELVDGAENERAVREYGRIEERFSALGGYAAESEAARICAHLGLPDRVLEQQIATLSGGQRRRVELARILFSATDGGASSNTTLLLDEPTNHLDADSITWLRSFLLAHDGGLVVISHDTDLLAAVVNKVWFLDATRGEIDGYNMNWKRYQEARRHRREAPPPRARQRREEGRRAAHPGAEDGREGHEGRRGEEHGPARRRAAVRSGARAQERPRGAHPLPRSGPLRAHPADRGGPVEGVRLAGGVHRRRPGRRPGREGRRAGAQRRGQDHAAAPARRHRGARLGPRRARSRAAHGLLRAGARDARPGRQRLGQHPARLPGHREQQLRTLLGTFMFSGEQLQQPAGTLSGGRRRRLALAGLVSSAAERAAARRAHQQPRPGQPRPGARRPAPLHRGRGPRLARPGAVEALHPDKVIVLPDGTEDLWSAEYLSSCSWPDRTIRPGRTAAAVTCVSRAPRSVRTDGLRHTGDARPGAAPMITRTRAPFGGTTRRSSSGSPSPGYVGRAIMTGGGAADEEEHTMPDLKKGARITGTQRDKLATDLKKKYEKGASIRALAEQTGRSYGFVHRVLSETGVTLRGRGGATRTKKKV
jgi:ATPase subunit of ABC transporter with duplicated ATPase domains